VQSHLFAQTVLARKVGFGAAAQPRPTQGLQRKYLILQMKEFGGGVQYRFPTMLTDSGGCPTCSEVQSHLSPQRALAELPDSRTLRGPCRKPGRVTQRPLVLLKIVFKEELPYNFIKIRPRLIGKADEKSHCCRYIESLHS
jgi:hypothetical protein